MVYCSSCGFVNPEESAFCGRCGSRLSSPPTAIPESQIQPTRQQNALPSFLQGSLVLGPRERVIRTLYGATMAERNQNGNKLDISVYGCFVISNQRAVFLGSYGVVHKSFYLVTEVALENIKGMTFKDGFFAGRELVINHLQDGKTCARKVSGLYELRENSFKQGEPTSIQSVHQQLNALVQARLHEIEQEKRSARIQYVLDFSFLKAEMERGGVVVQTIRCPSCGAGITLPSTGTSARCPYCGSVVYAHDVFEKMKGLIGGL